MMLNFHKYLSLYYLNILIQYIYNDNCKKFSSIEIYKKNFFLVIKNIIYFFINILNIFFYSFLINETIYRFDLWK